MKISFFAILMLFSISSFSHGGKTHNDKESKKNETNEKLKQINTMYLKDVKPIFQTSCFDCHGSLTKYPWYYGIPGVKQLIDADIEEAKEHLDFSSDFPFISHETPINDLKSISTSIIKNTMPPLAYRIMHSDNALTQDEIKIINDWVRISLENLK